MLLLQNAEVETFMPIKSIVCKPTICLMNKDYYYYTKLVIK